MDSSFQSHVLDESAFDDKGLSSLRTFDAFRKYSRDVLDLSDTIVFHVCKVAVTNILPLLPS